jgi:hypothetical protein
MPLRELSDVVGEHAGLSRTVLEYGLLMKRLVERAKRPGFSVESWAPLAELVAVDDFDRVGPFKEVMDWAEYVAFLTNWRRRQTGTARSSGSASSRTWCSSSSKNAAR